MNLHQLRLLTFSESLSTNKTRSDKYKGKKIKSEKNKAVIDKVTDKTSKKTDDVDEIRKLETVTCNRVDTSAAGLTCHHSTYTGRSTDSYIRSTVKSSKDIESENTTTSNTIKIEKTTKKNERSKRLWRSRHIFTKKSECKEKNDMKEECHSGNMNISSKIANISCMRSAPGKDVTWQTNTGWPLKLNDCITINRKENGSIPSVKRGRPPKTKRSGYSKSCVMFPFKVKHAGTKPAKLPCVRSAHYNLVHYSSKINVINSNTTLRLYQKKSELQDKHDIGFPDSKICKALSSKPHVDTEKYKKEASSQIYRSECAEKTSNEDKYKHKYHIKNPPLILQVIIKRMNKILKATYFYTHHRSKRNILKCFFFSIIILAWSPCLILFWITWHLSHPFGPRHLVSSENKTSYPLEQNKKENKFVLLLRQPFCRWRKPGMFFHCKSNKWHNHAVNNNVQTIEHASIQGITSRKSPHGSKESGPNPNKNYALRFIEGRGWVIKAINNKHLTLSQIFSNESNYIHPSDQSNKSNYKSALSKKQPISKLNEKPNNPIPSTPSCKKCLAQLTNKKNILHKRSCHNCLLKGSNEHLYSIPADKTSKLHQCKCVTEVDGANTSPSISHVPNLRTSIRRNGYKVSEGVIATQTSEKAVKNGDTYKSSAKQKGRLQSRKLNKKIFSNSVQSIQNNIATPACIPCISKSRKKRKNVPRTHNYISTNILIPKETQSKRSGVHRSSSVVDVSKLAVDIKRKRSRSQPHSDHKMANKTRKLREQATNKRLQHANTSEFQTENKGVHQKDFSCDFKDAGDYSKRSIQRKISNKNEKVNYQQESEVTSQSVRYFEKTLSVMELPQQRPSKCAKPECKNKPQICNGLKKSPRDKHMPGDNSTNETPIYPTEQTDKSANKLNKKSTHKSKNMLTDNKYNLLKGKTINIITTKKNKRSMNKNINISTAETDNMINKNNISDNKKKKNHDMSTSTLPNKCFCWTNKSKTKCSCERLVTNKPIIESNHSPKKATAKSTQEPTRKETKKLNKKSIKQLTNKDTRKTSKKSTDKANKDLKKKSKKLSTHKSAKKASKRGDTKDSKTKPTTVIYYHKLVRGVKWVYETVKRTCSAEWNEKIDCSEMFVRKKKWSCISKLFPSCYPYLLECRRSCITTCQAVMLGMAMIIYCPLLLWTYLCLSICCGCT